MLGTMAGRILNSTGSVKLTRDILFEKALYQAACKAAIKGGRSYAEGHIEWLVKKLMEIPDITFCPHGRPVAMELSHHTLDKHLEENVLTPTNIDPNASSASELVCEILELSIPDGYLRAEEAQLMLIGILLDTQFFTRDTGSRTFRACSYLRMAGADPAKAKLLFKTDLAEFDRIDQFEQKKYVFHDQFMISYFDGESDQNNMVAAAKSAERLVNIDGIVASFVLYTLDTGISLSARSDGTFNVVNIVRRGCFEPYECICFFRVNCINIFRCIESEH
jgi:hypothetical protein